MSGKTRASILSLTVILVLLFSAVGPTIVYADGGTTPETPPTEATSNPDETGTEATDTSKEASTETTSDSTDATTEATDTSKEASAEVTSEPTKEGTGEETSTSEEASADAVDEGASAEETTASESKDQAAPDAETETPASDSNLLSEVPDNTTVTVLDANGEAQPLASQESADAIAATSDPIWCPAGQDPTPGENGCTPSFDSFDALLTYLSGNPDVEGDGTIYVQSGAYQGGETSIDFNSYDLNNISNADLSITGGWNPNNNNTVDPATPSTFNVPILIGSSTNPWGGSLTISNITISDTVGTGLTVYTEENITITDVNVSRSETGAGAELNADGDVTVLNSNFVGNRTGGAIIRAGGRADVIDSSFTDPGNLQNQDRQAIGLDIESGGETSLFGVLASGNSIGGVNIFSGGAVTIVDSIFSENKSMQGTEFEGYGLQVVTDTDIALDGVTADDNFLWGALLDTTEGNGNIDIINSQFNANTTESPGFIDDTGLFIFSGGSVALTNVEASENRLYGAQITADGSVDINDSTFNNNEGVIADAEGTTTYNGHGLQITAGTDISLSNVTATGNMLFGAQLNAGGEVAVAFSEFSDTNTGTSTVLGEGLEVVAGGPVSLFEVVLDNNQSVGADIQTNGNVTLTNVTATNNGTDGVLVNASCVTVADGTYTGNGQYGLNLGTSSLNQTGAPVFSGNNAGNINPATPPVCGDLGGGGGIASNNVFVSLQTSNLLSSASLNSLLALTKTGRSIFIGKYDYVHTNAGMHIIAYPASSNQLAMLGS